MLRASKFSLVVDKTRPVGDRAWRWQATAGLAWGAALWRRGLACGGRSLAFDGRVMACGAWGSGPWTGEAGLVTSAPVACGRRGRPVADGGLLAAGGSRGLARGGGWHGAGGHHPGAGEAWPAAGGRAEAGGGRRPACSG
jgi:hypothetical protein